jgi:hypothetical protein
VLEFLNVKENSVAQNGQRIGVKYALLNSLLHIKAADNKQHSADAIEDAPQALASLLFLQVESSKPSIE